MSLSIRRLDAQEEQERIYAFRYRVYVEQLGLTTQADHGRRWLYDGLDPYSVSYAVIEDGEVLGSLRCTYLADLPDPQPLIDKFQMRPAVEAFGIGAMVTTSRFILDPRLRTGSIIFRLMQAAYEDARVRGIRLNYGDCSPHLLPFYEHLGYRRYTHGFNDTAFGYKVPILMLVGDRDGFRRVRSPLARLADRAPDDAAMRV